MRLFMDEFHPRSGRCVILEDNGSSAWLYLTSKEGKGIEKDAFAYSPIKPMDELNKAEIASGSPPVLIKRIASSEAVIEAIEEKKFEFKWSTTGESVALIYKNKPFAMIHAEFPRGFSRALTKESGFGNPWNQDAYIREFE